MLFLKIVEGLRDLGEKKQPAPSTASPVDRLDAAEDAVDALLRKKDGRIVRGMDPHYCRHGPQGMCSHCQPLDPFDSNYQREAKIKHLSFHAYMRKLSESSAHDIGPLLEEPHYSVKRDCTNHPPYPEGICTKCQPSAIILTQQPFRLVDHVEFETAHMVEEFLHGWRSTGFQRFGWLLGRFEPYDGVPLGIKVVVSAIYEPPQDGSIDGFQLLPDENEGFASTVANPFNMAIVGMLYTDLTDDGTKSGRVECRRSAETFFVSSAEALFMAQQQIAHPSTCKDSNTGRFSSKFVTVIITGNEKHEIDLMAYQVSSACEAMARSDLIEATTDPSLMMVKPSEPKHYIPDVIYKLVDEYKNSVQRKADPFFPVDYLLLTLSHGFPVKPEPTFKSPDPFPSLLSRATMRDVGRYIQACHALSLDVCLSNFNLLVFLCKAQIFSAEEFKLLCGAVRRRDSGQLDAISHSGSWATLISLTQSEEGMAAASSTASQGGRDWQCPHCTFLNVGGASENCEMCGLPCA